MVTRPRPPGRVPAALPGPPASGARGLTASCNPPVRCRRRPDRHPPVSGPVPPDVREDGDGW